jgi:hypothetical protein
VESIPALLKSLKIRPLYLEGPNYGSSNFMFFEKIGSMDSRCIKGNIKETYNSSVVFKSNIHGSAGTDQLENRMGGKGEELFHPRNRFRQVT